MLTAYLAALERLCQPIRAADYPRSLDAMHRLLNALGNPEMAYTSIVVTGSVGKGTACLNIAAQLRALTPPVGLFIGPHLHLFRERFSINNAIISQSAFIRLAERVLSAAQALGEHYSTFELATALAACWFAEQGVQCAVWEVGIGGRFDAVNAIPHAVAVLMPIEREHLAMLGGSLAMIAWHKAGIIPAGGVAYSVQQDSLVADVLRDEAEQIGAVVKNLTPSPSPTLHPSGVMGDVLPARLERVIRGRQTWLMDGGHTAASGARLRAALDAWAGDSPVRLLIGLLRDKAARDYLLNFDHPRFHITFTTAPGHRATPPHDLAERAAFRHTAVDVCADLDTAFAQAADAEVSWVVVCGSLRMGAAAREWLGLLTPEDLAEAQATRAIFEGESYLGRVKNN